MKENYYLYGVEVTKEFYFSDKTKLNPEIILQEQNAQKRMMYIQLIGIDKLLEKFPHVVIEEIIAEDLYKKFPIGDYYQQGDVLIKSTPITIIPYKELSNEMKIKIKFITYKLFDITISNEKWRYLMMASASIKGILHCEGIVSNCQSVFDAICWRNGEKSLPFELT